jgi:hypothetical protein
MLGIPAGQRLRVTSPEKHPTDPAHPLHRADRNGNSPVVTPPAFAVTRADQFGVCMDITRRG